MRWFDYPIGVPFGNPNYDTALGGSHDMTILALANMPVTSLVSGYVSDISAPPWGKQVGIELDTPINGVGWFHYLHLSATNPELSLGKHIEVGDLIGWVGGANTQAQYGQTSNPTGQNFCNDTFNSSRVQVGIALMRGPAYGGQGWQTFPPIDRSLDPTPTLLAARAHKEEIPMVDYPEAINMMLPLSYSFSSNAHKKIVDHGTGGNMTLDSLYQTFMSTMRSTHFGIDRAGRVAQFVPLSRGAGGNCCPDHDAQGHIVCSSFWLPLLSEFGNLNLCTISIEHCNDSENSLALTDAQRAASHKLNLWLCQRYHLTTNDIHSHASINPINKARCPGPAFDFGQMFDYINDGLATTGGGTDVFSNELCIAVYESYFKSVGKTPPPRETGIFRSWRALWISGHFKGCCLSGEYPVTLPNGHAGVAQDYAGGTCVWDSSTSIPTWL